MLSDPDTGTATDSKPNGHNTDIGNELLATTTGTSSQNTGILPVGYFITVYQGFGSGSGLDPDSATLWIRIRDPDSQYGSGSGSRGKKIKKFHCKNALFNYF
jgi:hypothetical protein